MSDESDKQPPVDSGTESAAANETAENTTAKDEAPPKSGVQLGPPVFGRYAIWIVLVPFVVYLVGTMVGGYIEQLRIEDLTGEIDDLHGDEHRLPQEYDIEQLEREATGERFLFNILPKDRSSYPYTYTTTIAITTLLMLIVSPGYFRAPFKITPWSFAVGMIGVVAWIGLARIDDNLLNFGTVVAKWLGGERPAFNPFEELKGSGAWMWQFLAIRFFGLVVVVSITEEFFLRGFLMRYVEDPDWDLVPLAVVRPWVWLVPTAYGIFAHPAEPLSALVWFSLVSWMYKKTGSVWDCVVAHAVTNALLGIYVVQFEAWYLW